MINRNANDAFPFSLGVDVHSRFLKAQVNYRIHPPVCRDPIIFLTGESLCIANGFDIFVGVHECVFVCERVRVYQSLLGRRGKDVELKQGKCNGL